MHINFIHHKPLPVFVARSWRMKFHAEILCLSLKTAFCSRHLLWGDGSHPGQFLIIAAAGAFAAAELLEQLAGDGLFGLLHGLVTHTGDGVLLDLEGQVHPVFLQGLHVGQQGPQGAI